MFLEPGLSSLAQTNYQRNLQIHFPIRQNAFPVREPGKQGSKRVGIPQCARFLLVWVLAHATELRVEENSPMTAHSRLRAWDPEPACRWRGARAGKVSRPGLGSSIIRRGRRKRRQHGKGGFSKGASDWRVPACALRRGVLVRLLICANMTYFALRSSNSA